MEKSEAIDGLVLPGDAKQPNTEVLTGSIKIFSMALGPTSPIQSARFRPSSF